MPKFFLFTAFLFMTLLSVANTFYLDPNNGSLDNDGKKQNPWSSLEEVIKANYITSYQYSPFPYDPEVSVLVEKNSDGFVTSGDTLVLLNGLHGEAFLQSYSNTDFITVIAEEGHSPVIEYVKLQACKNWRFENVKVSSEEYGHYLNGTLFFIETHGYRGPSSCVEVIGCEIYSSQEPWDTAEEWLANVSSGLNIKGDSVLARNNIIRNVDMGLTASGDYITAENNQIINFSGDGMRMLGSFNVFESNLIKNSYDVDDNHDDGIQSFTTNGLVVDNNKLIGNIIINTDDTDRPLNGSLQGIGCFDGFFNNWEVVNNLIFVDHYHAITFLGARNCTIVNNTAIDPTPDIKPDGSWIRIGPHKDGTPSSGCIVANNVSNKFIVDGLQVNNTILDTYKQYEENFVDYENLDFRLKPESILIDSASADYSPDMDIDGISRLLDNAPDVGAYEYTEQIISSIKQEKKGVEIYPNPFMESIIIEGAVDDWEIELFDLNQKLIAKTVYMNINTSISGLKKGAYLLKIKNNNYVFVKMILKK